MSSNYTGSATTTQAPGPLPNPGVFPIVQLPSDGDGLNAAGAAQAWKECADFIAWLMTPRAKASDWAAPIVTWMSAALKSRFIVDHQGFPGGQFQQWQECWQAAQSLTMTGSGSAGLDFTNGWTGTVIKGATAGTTALVTINNPDSAWHYSRYIQMTAGDTVNDSAYLLKRPCAQFQTDGVVTMEWSMGANAYGAVPHIIAGFNADNVIGTHAAIAQFRYEPSRNGNWWIETDDGTTLTSTDTTIAATSAFTRFRIEVSGATVGDGSVARASFFINGAAIGSGIPTTLPISAASPLVQPHFNLQRVAAGAAPSLLITPVRFTSTLWPNSTI